VSLAVIFWAGIVRNIVGLCLLPEDLATQNYPDFLESVLPGLLEDVAAVVISVRRSPSELWGKRPVGRDIQEGGLDVEGRLHDLSRQIYLDGGT
jgi:hypothetical protein